MHPETARSRRQPAPRALPRRALHRRLHHQAEVTPGAPSVLERTILQNTARRRKTRPRFAGETVLRRPDAFHMIFGQARIFWLLRPRRRARSAGSPTWVGLHEPGTAERRLMSPADGRACWRTLRRGMPALRRASSARRPDELAAYPIYENMPAIPVGTAARRWSSSATPRTQPRQVRARVRRSRSRTRSCWQSAFETVTTDSQALPRMSVCGGSVSSASSPIRHASVRARPSEPSAGGFEIWSCRSRSGSLPIRARSRHYGGPITSTGASTSAVAPSSSKTPTHRHGQWPSSVQGSQVVGLARRQILQERQAATFARGTPRSTTRTPTREAADGQAMPRSVRRSPQRDPVHASRTFHASQTCSPCSCEAISRVRFTLGSVASPRAA